MHMRWIHAYAVDTCICGGYMHMQWIHAYAIECEWDGAVKDLPTEFLDSRNGLFKPELCGAQQLMTGKRDVAGHADMLLSFDLNTTQGNPEAARLHGSSGGPAGTFLTAIPVGRMTLGNDIFEVSVWHHLGPAFPLKWPPCRANAVQELLLKQIMRWSARR